MKWIRNAVLVLAGLLFVIFVLAAHYYYKGFRILLSGDHTRAIPVAHTLSPAESVRIARKARALKLFAHSNGFNSRLVFLADMDLPLGKNRFFVYDLTGDSVLLTGLVAHGCGNKAFSIDPSFSNTDGSNCTALGRYRVGKPYKGQFGLAYKLDRKSVV